MSACLPYRKKGSRLGFSLREENDPKPSEFQSDIMDIEHLKKTSVPGPARGLQILVVDPDAAALMETASTLKKNNYKVSTVEIPTFGLGLIRANQYDLVIAEVNMPEMDGFTFLKHIQRETKTPTILMSGMPNLELAMRALEEGACFFWKKPLKPNDLMNAWQHIFRARVKAANQKLNKGKLAIQEEASFTGTEAAGGPKKGSGDGLGIQGSPLLLSSDASTAEIVKEMEAMRMQIAELTQKWKTSEANIAKLQKFMKMQMLLVSDDEEETGSNQV